MPALPQQRNLAQVRRILAYLFIQNYGTYHSLFIAAHTIPPESAGFNISPLIRSNLCTLTPKGLKSNFRITKIYDLFIITDLPSYQGPDRVWYLLDDESILFAHYIPDCSGKRVLDIGTGSGVLALVASIRGAKEVTAIDVSHRAIQIAAFNAALNGCDHISFLRKRLHDFKPKKPFDHIMFNPPFVPMPDRTKYMLSGYGGRDGLALVHAFFKNLDFLAHASTAISMISMSPGDRHISLLERLFLERYYGKNVEIVATDIYGSVVPIRFAFAPFRTERNFLAWKKWLAYKHYTHMHYLFITISPAARFMYRRALQVPQLEDLPESGTWRAMYAVIKNTKRHA